jgi:EmrB/QacA subfamily drug resistance transporter
MATERVAASQVAAPGAGPAKLDRAVVVTGLVVVAGQIMPGLDTTIVNVALGTLSRDLHASLPSTQWVITGYLLALGMVTPLSGWAADRFGATRVWITALALFTAGSALAGASWSIGSLIGFRVVQGVGGGMMMPLAQTIIARAAGPRQMGRAMSVLVVPTLLGPVLGPVIGGLLVEKVSWHWIFYVNVPVGIAAIALAAWKLPRGREHKAAAARLDLPGLALLAGGLLCLLYGLSQAGSQGSLTGGRVLGWLAAAVVCLAGFTAWSLARRDAAVVNVRLFSNRQFAASSALMFLVAISLFGGLLLLPLYYQAVRGQGALGAGLLLAPQGLGAMAAVPAAGKLTDRLGAGRVVLAGLVLALAGTVAFTWAGTHTSYAWLSLALFTRGAGVGAAVIPAFAAAYATLSRAMVSRAATMLSVISQVGAALGSALLVVVLTRRIADAFAAHGLATASSGPGRFTQLPAHLRQAAAPLLATGFSSAFWVAAGLTALAFLPAVLLRHHQQPTAEPPGAPPPAP